MTLIVATITPERGWLSSDSWLEWRTPPTAELLAQFRRIYDEYGRDGFPVIDFDTLTARKVQVFERQRFAFVLSVMAGGVAFFFGAAVDDEAGDVDDGVELACAQWERVPAWERGGGNFIAIGWSAKHGRIVAYEASAPLMRPRLIEATRETLWTPDPPADCPQAEEIRAALESSRAGANVVQLHEAVFRAANWAAQRGRYRHHVGGRLTTVSIDATGCTITDGLDLGLPAPVAEPQPEGETRRASGEMFREHMRLDAERERRRAARRSPAK